MKQDIFTKRTGFFLMKKAILHMIQNFQKGLGFLSASSFFASLLDMCLHVFFKVTFLEESLHPFISLVMLYFQVMLQHPSCCKTLWTRITLVGPYIQMDTVHVVFLIMFSFKSCFTFCACQFSQGFYIQMFSVNMTFQIPFEKEGLLT